ncbi:MAG: hypothetical protein FWG85_05505 [Bacteroidetes bacterium]|nr:hypothetical protein [Bacteroidota bacterium]
MLKRVRNDIQLTRGKFPCFVCLWSIVKVLVPSLSGRSRYRALLVLVAEGLFELQVL